MISSVEPVAGIRAVVEILPRLEHMLGPTDYEATRRGLGRHHIGSNFFWYLKDPAGYFSEYYSDMETIVDDQTWTPEDFEGAAGLYRWVPPPPPSFLHPDDLAALMTGSHSAGG